MSRSAMRSLLTLLSGVLLAFFVQVIATWADARWHLSGPQHITIVLGAFGLFVLTCFLLEVGVPVPGRIAFHRFWYLYELRHSAALKRWEKGYARLHLGRGPRYIDAAEVLAEGERRPLVELLTGSVVKRGSVGSHILVLGEPGSGKSTALRRLTLDLARYSARRLGLAGPIPVLVNAGDCHPGQDLRTILTDAIGRDASKRTAKVLTDPDVVAALLHSGNVAILVDALDEISGERLDTVLNVLASASGSHASGRPAVIVTCRTRQDPRRALPGYQTYSVLDLSDEAVSEFIRIYSEKTGADPEDVHRRLDAAGFLEAGGVGRNPFWLKQLIDIDVETHARSGILCAATREALLSELLDKPSRVRRKWRRPSHLGEEQYAEECLWALSHLAMNMDMASSTKREDARQQLVAWMRGRVHEVGVTADVTPDDILELSCDAGLLAATAQEVSFAHRLFQEFFTARALPDPKTFVAQRLKAYVEDLGRWQTLALYAGLASVEESGELIRSILKSGNPPQALACALATYAGDNQMTLGSLADELCAALRDRLASAQDLSADLCESLRQFFQIGGDVACALVGQLLADPLPAVRRRVCDLLGLSESPEAVRLLAFVGLDDTEDVVGQAAIDALAGAGGCAVWPLIRQLSAERERVRTRAAQALGRLAAPEAANYLLTCEVDDDVAVEALTRCGAHRVGRLLVALAMGETRERCRAVRALREVDEPRVLTALERAVGDEEGRVREVAVDALARRVPAELQISQNSEAEPREAPRVLTGLGAVLESRASSYVKAGAIDVLAQLGDPTAPWVLGSKYALPAEAIRCIDAVEVAKALLTALGDRDAIVREEAAMALAELPGDGVLRVISEAANEHADLRVRAGAAMALSGRGEAEAVDILLRVLARGAGRVCAEAVKGLAGKEDPRVTEALLSAARDPACAYREAAVGILSKREGDRVTSTLVEVARAREEPVRRTAIEALAEREGDGVTSVLIEVARTEEGPVRQRAIEALAEREGDRVIPVLADIAEDADDPHRVVATRALSRVGHPRAAYTLLSLAAAEVAEDDELPRQPGGLRSRSLEPLVLVPVDDEQPASVEQVARKGLSEAGEPCVARVILQAARDDTDHNIRRTALEILPELPYNRAWPDNALRLRDDLEIPSIGPGPIGPLAEPEHSLEPAREEDAERRREAVAALSVRRGASVTRALLEALHDGEDRVRLAAVEGLRGRSGSRVTDALLGAVEDEDRDVRWTAVRALRDRRDSRITNALVEVATDEDSHLRLAAVEGLRGRRGAAVTDALIAAVDDTEGAVRLAAVESLGGRRGARVEKALLGALEDEDEGVCLAALKALVTGALLQGRTDAHPRVRRAAIQGLGGEKGPFVTAALLQSVRDGSAEIRQAAVEALAGRGDARVIEALVEAVDDPGAAVRLAAVDALVDGEFLVLLGGPEHRHVTAAVLRAAEDADGDVRLAAMEALGHQDETATAALVKGAGDLDPRVRRAALAGLRGRRDGDVREALLSGVDDPDEGVRLTAVEGLGAQEVGTVTTALVKAGADVSPVVREAAMEALSGREAPAVTAALMKRADDPVGSVRSVAIRGLRGRTGTGIADVLLKALADTEDSVRVAAVEALEGHQDVRVTDGLLAKLGDPSKGVRCAVVRALGNQGDPRAADGLLRALGDTESEVRRAAMHACSECRDTVPMEALDTAARGSGPAADHAGEAALARRRGAAEVLGRDTAASVGALDVGPWLMELVASRGTPAPERTSQIDVGGTGLAECALTALGHADPDVRYVAAEMLARDVVPQGRTMLIEGLVSMLTTGTDRVRLGWMQGIRLLLDSLGQNFPYGPQVAALLLEAMDDASPAVRDAASHTLAALPVAWAASALTGQRASSVGSISASYVVTLGRCGHPRAPDLLSSAISTPGSEAQIPAIRAAGAIGDARVLPAISGVLQETSGDVAVREAAIHAASLMGLAGWQQLRGVLDARVQSEGMLCAAAIGLGMSGDASEHTLRRLLRLLGHSSEDVRKASISALCSVVGQARAFPVVLLGARSPEPRMFGDLLLSVLEGGLVPERVDADGRWLPEPGGSGTAGVPDGDRAVTLGEHLRELLRRAALSALAVAGAGAVGALFAGRIVAWLAALCGVPAEALTCYMPPGPFLREAFGLVFAAWAGAPLLLHQFWRFAEPGLYGHERRVVRWIVTTLALLILAAPVLTCLACRLISILPLLRASWELPPRTVAWLGGRVGMGGLIVCVWGVGFRPLWRWLALGRQARYLRLLTVDDAPSGDVDLARLARDTLLWTALCSSTLVCLLPAYLSASLLLGFPICILWAAAHSTRRFLLIRERRRFPQTLLGGLLGGAAAASMGLYLFPVVAGLLSVFRGQAVAAFDWLAFGALRATGSSQSVQTGGSMTSYLIFIHASWLAAVIGVATHSVLRCVSWRGGSDRSPKPVMGSLLVGVLIAVVPIVFARWWVPATNSFPCLANSPYLAYWLYTRLVPFTTALLLGLLIAYAAGRSGRLNSPLMAVLGCAALLAGGLPVPVTAAPVALSAIVAVFLLPAVARLVFNRAYRDAARVFVLAFREEMELLADNTAEALSG